MDAENLAGFHWLFAEWHEIVTSMIVLTQPIFAAMAEASRRLVTPVGYACAVLILFNLSKGSLLSALLTSAAVWLALSWGLKPTDIKTSESGTVSVTNISALGYNASLSVQGIFAETMGVVLKHVKVDGGVLPAQAATQAAVDRAADQFAGTDLARLIRDYNQQCGPEGGVIRTREQAGNLSAYHAIGLAGGAGLGMPDDEITHVAQMMKLYDGAVDFVSGKTNSATGNAMERVFDAGAIRERRAAGIAILEAEGRGFISNTPYLLPKEGYWASVYRADEVKDEPARRNEYLSHADARFEIRPDAWSEEDGQQAAQGFSPGSCVDAYRLAQLGAEQAYRALIATGGTVSSGQRANVNASRLGAAQALQRVINRSMNGGVLDGGSFGQAVGGVVAVTQAVKNEIAWYEMYTLIPSFIGGIGALLWFLLMAAPVFLLIAPVVGVESITGWASGVLFSAFAIVFAQTLTVGLSIALTGAAVYQAGMAAGWNGGGGASDLILGMLPLGGPFIVVASTFFAGLLTKFSITQLSGAARSAVATTTDFAKGAASIAQMGFALSRGIGRIRGQAASTAERAAKSAQQNGGGGGRNGGAAAPSQSHFTGSGSSGSDGSGAGLAKKATNFGQMKRRLNARAEAQKNEISLTPKKSEE